MNNIPSKQTTESFPHSFLTQAKNRPLFDKKWQRKILFFCVRAIKRNKENTQHNVMYMYAKFQENINCRTKWRFVSIKELL